MQATKCLQVTGTRYRFVNLRMVFRTRTQLINQVKINLNMSTTDSMLTASELLKSDFKDLGLAVCKTHYRYLLFCKVFHIIFYPGAYLYCHVRSTRLLEQLYGAHVILALLWEQQYGKVITLLTVRIKEPAESKVCGTS